MCETLEVTCHIPLRILTILNIKIKHFPFVKLQYEGAKSVHSGERYRAVIVLLFYVCFVSGIVSSLCGPLFWGKRELVVLCPF